MNAEFIVQIDFLTSSQLHEIEIKELYKNVLKQDLFAIF